MTSFFAYLAEKEVEYKRDYPLSEYSTMRVGGCADAVVYPQSVDELVSIIRYINKKEIKHKIVGRMSNILPSDLRYNGVIVSTLKVDHFRVAGNSIDVECGALISGLVLRLAKESIGGIEELFGIPGTVGGAVFSNAGAFGVEISDVIFSAYIYDALYDEVREIFFDEMLFSYRKSVLSDKRYILLSVRLSLKSASYDLILEKIKRIRQERQSRQPTSFPSLGSIFKRYEGVSAGYYIEKAGLSSYSIGGAAVSDKHAGFIVNMGNASSEDVRSLISHVKDVVFNKFSILLEEEIEFL